MNCPSCGAEVEEGADLCLECGEPMGDSPAARLARAGTGAPAATATAPPGGGVVPAVGAAKASPSTPAGAMIGKLTAKPAAATAGNAAAATPAKPTWRKWREEEPEPVRCPGCGLKTLAARCPSCGTRLRSDDD